ncbi:NAD(P)H-dependent oxidoreductase [Alteromonas oceanisediminis]|uniref:NAD(P)H-dependent oxidoreductase n=1 Tax=Alteromonas oceanisediminis TaxID=2836180 RepID=UPI0028F43FD8|nr:NAD(P)H-dependent oxidoreductase [Alteromonas oceanisediminis]
MIRKISAIFCDFIRLSGGVKSSIDSQNGNASLLADSYTQAVQRNGNVTVVERALTQQSMPHLDQNELAAWQVPELQRSEEQAHHAALSDEIVSQVQSADEIVLAVPMYNFGIPSTLKAWFDRCSLCLRRGPSHG